MQLLCYQTPSPPNAEPQSSGPTQPAALSINKQTWLQPPHIRAHWYQHLIQLGSYPS